MRIVVLFLLFFFVSYAQEDVWVNTSTGGYYRTAPNSTNMDNYSTRGNTNPYTGKAGTIAPDYHNSALSSLNSLLSQPVYNLPTSETYVSSYPRIEIDLPKLSSDPYQTYKVSETKSNSPSFRGGKYFKIVEGRKNYVKQTISRL